MQENQSTLAEKEFRQFNKKEIEEIYQIIYPQGKFGFSGKFISIESEKKYLNRAYIKLF